MSVTVRTADRDRRADAGSSFGRTGASGSGSGGAPGGGPVPVPGDAVLTMLVVDPHADALGDLVESLRARDVTVIVCDDGAEALLWAGSTHPDVLLVGADLPLLSGATVVHVLRRHREVPVIFGVGPDDAYQASQALAAGATACVARPYRLHELLPILRGVRPGALEEDKHTAVLCIGSIRLDPLAHDLRVAGRSVHLPPREFDLLHFLMTHSDRVVTRDQIRAALWSGATRDANTINVHIRRLRSRLGDDPKKPRIIRTIRNVGYRFCSPELP